MVKVTYTNVYFLCVLLPVLFTIFLTYTMQELRIRFPEIFEKFSLFLLRAESRYRNTFVTKKM